MNGRIGLTGFESRMARWFERWESSLKGKLFPRSDSPPEEPAELFQFLTDRVASLWEANLQERYFPAARVGLTLFVDDPARQTACERLFIADRAFEKAVRGQLVSLDCRVPPGFRVDVACAAPASSASPGGAAGSSPAPAFAIDFPIADSEAPRRWRLRVLTDDTIFNVPDGVTKIGRQASATRHGRIVRFNQLVLANNGVSRGHAHLRCNLGGGCLHLFQDNARNETYVWRNQASHRISVTGTGFQLRAGDVIIFGPVSVVVEEEPKAEEQTKVEVQPKTAIVR